MCGKRTHTTWLKMIAAQSVGTNTPFCTTYPTGCYIHELLTRIQNADIVVPAATRMHDVR